MNMYAADDDDDNDDNVPSPKRVMYVEAFHFLMPRVRHHQARIMGRLQNEYERVVETTQHKVGVEIRHQCPQCPNYVCET